MMSKRIRSMIDEIFSEMKMTAENLALRDELMANAQARYEDSVAQGKSEEEAFKEVAASLGDVQALLREIEAGAPEFDGQSVRSVHLTGGVSAAVDGQDIDAVLTALHRHFTFAPDAQKRMRRTPSSSRECNPARLPARGS